MENDYANCSRVPKQEGTHKAMLNAAIEIKREFLWIGVYSSFEECRRTCFHGTPGLSARNIRLWAIEQDHGNASSVVYFVKARKTKLIKIGHTCTLRQRMISLRRGSPDSLSLIASCPGTKKDERRLHRRFASSRSHGEWFQASDELNSLIARISARK